MVTNLLALFGDKISGGAIIAASGPCGKIKNELCKRNYKKYLRKLPKSSLIGKPIYVFGGYHDSKVKIHHV